MYGPRWVWAIPMAVFLPAAFFLRRRLLTPLLAATMLLLFPVMRLCLPWRTVLPAAGQPGPTLRILSCNIDRSSLDTTAFAKLVADIRPDIVAAQDWGSRHERPVFGRARGPGHWYVHREDELFLASRHPIGAVRLNTDPSFAAANGSMAMFEVRTPAGNVHVVNLHLATARDALEAVAGRRSSAADLLRRNIDLRRRQSLAASALAKESVGPVVVMGDFNTPPDSNIQGEAWSGLTNAFSFAGTGFGNTHFTRRTSVRIDHILAGPGWRVRRCWVGPDVGSAHRPLIADLEWRGTN